MATKFYQNHWEGEKAALGFGPDLIRTLVSMATYISHRIIMGENLVNRLNTLILQEMCCGIWLSREMWYRKSVLPGTGAG